MDGLQVYKAKSHLEMDDFGYPYSRKPPDDVLLWSVNTKKMCVCVLLLVGSRERIEYRIYRLILVLHYLNMFSRF